MSDKSVYAQIEAEQEKRALLYNSLSDCDVKLQALFAAKQVYESMSSSGPIQDIISGLCVDKLGISAEEAKKLWEQPAEPAAE